MISLDYFTIGDSWGTGITVLPQLLMSTCPITACLIKCRFEKSTKSQQIERIAIVNRYT